MVDTLDAKCPATSELHALGQPAVDHDVGAGHRLAGRRCDEGNRLGQIFARRHRAERQLRHDAVVEFAHVLLDINPRAILGPHRAGGDAVYPNIFGGKGLRERRRNRPSPLP